MIVNKFGGASVKDADSIVRMAKICQSEIKMGIVVVSAMGKTTNKLERISDNFFSGLSTAMLMQDLREYYNSTITSLFSPESSIQNDINNYLQELETLLSGRPGLNYDFEYDKIVPYGELISTKIIAAYLNDIGIDAKWIDIRKSLKTDSTYREGKVDWELTASLISQEFSKYNTHLYITQGFIGSDINNLNTTLGREGSDYTAAILANVLNAEKVSVWKDVPGILCADPAWMPNTDKLESISYNEAIELTFYGAKVIHPKTIKPLQNKSIPLQVRSFVDINEEGTIIANIPNVKTPSVFIRKEDQVLISIKPFDFSFIVEENLSHIFGVFSKYQIKVNLMQNSAVSFSVCVDGEIDRVKNAIRELKKQYDVKYNDNLELISIRHNTKDAEERLTADREILLEQRSRSMLKFVARV